MRGPNARLQNLSATVRDSLETWSATGILDSSCGRSWQCSLLIGRMQSEASTEIVRGPGRESPHILSLNSRGRFGNGLKLSIGWHEVLIVLRESIWPILIFVDASANVIRSARRESISCSVNGSCFCRVACLMYFKIDLSDMDANWREWWLQNFFEWASR
jgi:hypothetical protein